MIYSHWLYRQRVTRRSLQAGVTQRIRRMARCLSWKHLSLEQIAALRAAGTGSTQAADGAPAACSGRELLRQFLGMCQAPEAKRAQGCEPAAAASDGADDALRQDILLDLLSYTLQQGQAWGFDDERLSMLFGLVLEVHTSSVTQRLTIERSFGAMKDALLNHSVHRPPFSVGVFSQAEMRTVLDWLLAKYYRHYKLYQYAFTNRVTLSVTTYAPSSLVEVPPTSLPPLCEALTEQQHQQEMDEQQRQAEQVRQQAAAAAAAAAEAEAARAVQEAYEASLPDDVKARVSAALEREVAYLRKAMEDKFQLQQAALLARLAQLEAGAVAAAQHAPGAAAGVAAPNSSRKSSASKSSAGAGA